jgi:hypothetical protein
MSDNLFELKLFSDSEIDALLAPEETTDNAPVQSDDPRIPMKIVEETIPRIGKMIKVKWGRPDFYPYMDELLFSNRPDRQGFPQDMLTALIKLQSIHHKTIDNNKHMDISTGKDIRDIWAA